MTVERLLQLHVAVLAGLGTLLLGMGQRDVVLPILSIFAAATSVYFTDIVRWFVLSRNLGNIAALGAVMIASFQFWTIPADQQLLAIANLLVYLQIILLYQAKNSTRYWEIAVLSLLQVVVAAALNLGFEFGVLLVVYMLTAFSGLALFFIYREGIHFCAPDADDPQPVAAVPTKRRSLRRQLLGDPVQLAPLMPQTAFANGMTRNFTRNVAALSALTMAFSIVLFFSVPRTSSAVWQGNGDGMAQTGLPTDVTLNETGLIRQSDQVVMRVTFRRPGQDKPIQIAGEPYFYAAALTRYSTESGVSRWSNPAANLEPYRLVEPPAGSDFVYQDIVLNAANEEKLSAVPATYAPPGMAEQLRGRLRFDWRSGQLRRKTDEDVGRTFGYSLVTTGFKGNWQSPVVQHQLRPDLLSPSRSPDDVAKLKAALKQEQKSLLAIDRERFPKLIATAERVLRGTNLTDKERVVKATLLKDHFRAPNAYAYTLDFSKIPRAKDVDPIEDFVANHRTGHCEYFASALCLMLRSQGVPARIVVGYKSNEYNSLGNYYWVRQLHAHAWVEAFLERDQIPPGAIDPSLVTETGAWLRLDPTPASDGNDQLNFGTGLLARIGDATDYVQLLWDDYVLGLNSERQKKSIYNPLGNQAALALGEMLNTKDLANRLAGLADGKQWFSWQAGLVAAIASAALILLYQLASFLWHHFALWRRQRLQSEQRAERRVVEFYERLERLLAEAGIKRADNQTQREFASLAGARLAALGPEADGLTGLPGEVVEAFYRVRFGETALDPDRTTAIDQGLTRLASFLARPAT
jgi:transglutaminase-like putative cysteine protease